MTIKVIVFLLFLYVCLAWVGAGLLHQDEFVHYGLLWTAIGLIVVLALVIGARILGWWRLRRARAVARPAAPAKTSAVPIFSEEESALANLLAEANANLAKAPEYAGKQVAMPLSGKPLYLLIGPEGSGKTCTFVNSGLEPQLLAGQVSGTSTAMPTRLANIWIAGEAIFVELAGRAFSGDSTRWIQLLKVLRGNSTPAGWKQFWRPPEPGLQLHGVIAFCDAKEFTGTPSTQGLDRRSRDLQDRLQAVGDVFGVDFPVYQLFTKSDSIPYFPDFFRRLPEMEANQVFGCTLAAGGAAESSADEKAKQLTRTFRPLYQEIAKRRLTQLAHEPDPARRPAVYEFPRELKRIRTPLLQFLSDTFRPHPLKVGPLLRGYYLTAVREVEVAGAALTETRADWGPQKMEATRLFSSADATRMFRPADVAAAPKVGPGGTLVRRWIFTSDLFRNVVLADKSMRQVGPVADPGAAVRNGVLAGVCGVCLFLCLAFVWSGTRNVALLNYVQEASNAGIDQSGNTTLEKLGALDALRVRLQRLIDWGHSTPWGLAWGLYTGDRVLDSARQAYFRHFQSLLLNSLNNSIVTQMRALPLNPAEGQTDDQAHGWLETHKMIAGQCTPVDSAVVSAVLKSTRNDIKLAAGSQQEQDLADAQIDFYARELPHEKQWHVSPDTDGIKQATLYLQNSKGIERLYRGIIADIENKLPKLKPFAEFAPNYQKVLRGPEVPSAAYTLEGWKAFQKAAQAGKMTTAADPCVALGGGAQTQDAATAKKLQAKYYEEFIAHWRDFVRGFVLLPYNGTDDAATKLQTLADNKSPVLALLYLTSTETNLTVAPEETAVQTVKKAVDKAGFGGLFSKKKQIEDDPRAARLLQTDTKEIGPADVKAVFQPAQLVVPANSENWVGDKNRAYIESLQLLGSALHAVAANPTDPNAQQAAQQTYDKAIGAAKQIDLDFRSVGDDGVDDKVKNLLEQPILRAGSLITTDVGKVVAGQADSELRKLCAALRPVLSKFPFQLQAKEEVSPDEFQKWFGSNSPIWQFQQKSLADLATKQNGQWKATDPSKKPQVTEDMLAFLNRAQAISDLFFTGGTAQSLTYSLRPSIDSTLKDWKVSLVIDGQTVEWTPTSSLQKPFRWPAPSSKDQNAVGRLAVGGLSVPFLSRGGYWAVFRGIMVDAEPRPAGTKAVEWKYQSTGGGRGEPLHPSATLEIAASPNGVDVFRPQFFALHCPSRAVQ